MTVQQLINAALRSIGVLAAGESPSTDESNDGLTAANHLLASWSAQGLFIPKVTRDSLTLTGAASYTFGAAQTWNTARPVKIQSAAVIAANGVGQPLKIVDAMEWANVRDKDATGIYGQFLFWDGGYPTGVVYLAPKPSGGTVEMVSLKPLTAFAALGDAIDLNPGYERALRFALAVDLALEYGRQVDPALAAIAEDGKKSIAGLNAAVLGIPMPVGEVKK